jgi:hypothetical protein
MSASVLARLAPERRQLRRRGTMDRGERSVVGEEQTLVAASKVFEREERGVLRSLERRRQLRRRQDLARQLAHLQDEPAGA